MTFTATNSTSTLVFQSLDTGNSGAVIADVRVIEIPQAVQVLLNNDPILTYDAATGKFYKVNSTYTTFAGAQSTASSQVLNGITGQLAVVRSSYENDLIWAMARNANADLWLGGSDVTTEGNWRWLSGTTDQGMFWQGTATGTLQSGYYANWQASNPDNWTGGPSAGEDGLVMWRTTGQWNDADVANGSGATVIEWDASEVLSNFRYTITSDPSGAFSINADTGEITVSSASALAEIATNPTITIQVTGAAGNTYSEAMTITVNRVNDNTPVITSNGGGASAGINVTENTTTITTVVATDADLPSQSLTYSIIGGADQALFSIDSATGVLTFVTSRNFEAPGDAGSNNVYDVVVRVSDGTFSDDQSIAVTITNINEAPIDQYAIPSVTNANILGYYSFTSANNLGRDDAGDNQALTLFGSPTQTTRTGGSGALDLSGGQYGNISSMTTGGAMTIASWIRFDSTSANGF